MKEIYYDTDSEYTMKKHLNSMYGKMITNTDNDYIVVHEEGIEESNVGVLFKSKINGVLKWEDGTAKILLDGGNTIFTTDKYEDIIKQLV